MKRERPSPSISSAVQPPSGPMANVRDAGGRVPASDPSLGARRPARRRLDQHDASLGAVRRGKRVKVGRRSHLRGRRRDRTASPSRRQSDAIARAPDRAGASTRAGRCAPSSAVAPPPRLARLHLASPHRSTAPFSTAGASVSPDRRLARRIGGLDRANADVLDERRIRPARRTHDHDRRTRRSCLRRPAAARAANGVPHRAAAGRHRRWLSARGRRTWAALIGDYSV